MKYFNYIILSFLLLSCSTKKGNREESADYELIESEQNTEIENEVTNDPNEKIEDFRSELRATKTDWNEEDTFMDTLALVEYNTDADYFFAVFRNSNGTEVPIYTNEEINVNYLNRSFIVQWKVGKFYEAGEGDAIYYREQLVSSEVIETSFSLEGVSNPFEGFLNQFLDAYNSGDQERISTYVHPLVEQVSAYKMGLYCIEGRPDYLPNQGYFSGEYVISSEKPPGDFCEGYEGVNDGLYYEYFDESNDLFPRVYDMSEEGVEKVLYVTDEVVYEQFIKVMVIADEYFSQHLYFFKENDRWYFWVEDFCDCSA